MMTTLLGTGIYTIPEAARLTRVSHWRVRRWLQGYDFSVKAGRHHSPAVWHGQLEAIERHLALGFLDVIEMRFVDAFLRAGVSWKTLRRAHNRAQQFLNLSHPFCSSRFKVFGRQIILELPRDDAEPELWEIARDQRVFGGIVGSYLKDLEFGSGELPQRWWPRGRSHPVALDPRRSFGQPIIFEAGIPTRALARSVSANGSIEQVARWFEVSLSAVREAVAFEQSLVAWISSSTTISPPNWPTV
jgi:uncharacterized protein (DUF433 family)